MRRILLLDTDFLIKITNDPLPQLRRLLDEDEFSLFTLPSVKRELGGLKASERPATSRRAKLALESIGKTVALLDDAQLTQSLAEADEHLTQIAKSSSGRIVVATLDGTLLRRFEKMKVPYMTLRKDRPFLRNFP